MSDDKEEVIIIYNEGCPEWMLTMGDCMSLLLCFFVMMLAFSSPDDEKLMDVIAGMQGALGMVPPQIREKGVSFYKEGNDNLDDKVIDGEKVEKEFDLNKVSSVSLTSMQIINRYHDLKNRLIALGFKNIVTVNQLKEGIMMSVEYDSIFYKNTSKLIPAGTRLFDHFSNLMTSCSNEVKLTCTFKGSRTTSRRVFSGDWYLSHKRADEVSSHFVAKYTSKGKIVENTRFSFGTKVVSKGKPRLEIMIMEDVQETKEIGLEQLLKLEHQL